ncbi:MAG: hypothetical protein ACKO42_04190 [Gammaproteobacteria bacterium]
MSFHQDHDAQIATPSALRQSGGLKWHFRALRYRRLHEPFRRAIATFLQAWNPASTHLIIVGPSAGWFLPNSFLRLFSRLTLIDLDTSAPLFFNWRHGRVLRDARTAYEWVHADFVDCLPGLLSQHPKASVLFCNVLGQLGLERQDYETHLAQLSRGLEGRSWASFHDLYSSSILAGELSGASPFTSTEIMDTRMLQRLGCSGEWTDHGTGRVLPEGALRHYFPWRITPTRFHWIEAGAFK